MAQAYTGSGRLRLRRSCPEATSHTCSSLPRSVSPHAVPAASTSPRGEKASEITGSGVGSRLALPVGTSHTKSCRA